MNPEPGVPDQRTGGKRAEPAPAPKPVTPAPPTGQLSPVVIASVGTYSGPAAATLAPNLYGLQLWVKWINQRHGLGGHEVRLIVYDDGFDSARHNSVVKEAVEQKKVLAFVSNNTGVSTQGTVDYITSKRIPVIGSFGATLGFYTSPMYFPQQPHYDPLYETWARSAAQQFLPAKKRFALIYCTETAICTDVRRVYEQQAKTLGYDVVYQGRVSIAQPDYTAECLAARNASAEVIVPMMDSNSVNRLAASCARQSYKPAYNIGGAMMADRFKDDPNLAGAVGPTNVFPWFRTGGSPAVDEFQQAYKAFGGSLVNGAGLANGWVAAKLFEKAGANLPEPPTSDALLRGLWSIKNDDLGGLASPLTFVENQPATPVQCWWNVRVSQGAWASADNYTRHCA